MPFTIPDNDEAGVSTNQSVWMQPDVDALGATIGVGHGVMNGLAVAPQGSPNMTVQVSAGWARVEGIYLQVAAQASVTITAANATNPRIDLVVLSNAGVVSVTAGTAASNPKAATMPANSLLLAMVYVQAATTTIAASNIVDKRLFIRDLQLLREVAVDSDFIGGMGNLTASTSGTGASATTSQAGDATRAGVTRMSTGTTATGRAHIGAISGYTSTIRFGGGSWLFTSVVNVTTLSDVTNTFTVKVGFQDSQTAASADGVYFDYAHTVNAGNWTAITRNNSVETATNSAVAVTAGGWAKLQILVNAAGTEVKFYVNNTLVATHTTNIPTGAGRETSVYVSIIKSVGTTARTMDVDYMGLYGYMTGAR